MGRTQLRTQPRTLLLQRLRHPATRPHLAALALLLPVMVAGARVALDAPNALDPTFGNAGIVTTQIAGSFEALVLQPDGKLVALGGNFALVRYNPDGGLDPTFGDAGIVTTQIGTSALGNALVLQPDGKLVAAGSISDGTNAFREFVLVRYNSDGSLDPTFAGGIVSPQIGTLFDEAYALVLQPDGKLVAAGSTRNLSGISGFDNTDFALVRYNPDGSLDPTFGTAGVVITPVGSIDESDGARALALQPDGRLVAAGARRIGNEIPFTLVRYNPDGSLDPTFGSGGIVTTTTTLGTFLAARALVLQPDGRLVAAGEGESSLVNHEFTLALVRYNRDGGLDLTFGNAGIVTTQIGAAAGANALVLQPDGKLVAAGSMNDGTNNEFALVRYNPDGGLDPTFGDAGIVTTQIDTSALANALVLQPDGKLVAAGGAGGVLARYLSGRPNGASCTSSSECPSAFCSRDGVCCAQRCDAQNDFCALPAFEGTCVVAQLPTPTPTPQEPIGSACARGAECQSTFCTDGVCCDQACSAENESCVVPGFLGLCIALSLPGTPTPTSPTSAPTRSPTVASTPTAPLACVGDCNGDGHVTVDEILTMVNIALGNTPVTACEAGDADRDGDITVDEILTAVNNALNGCSGG